MAGVRISYCHIHFNPSLKRDPVRIDFRRKTGAYDMAAAVRDAVGNRLDDVEKVDAVTNKGKSFLHVADDIRRMIDVHTTTTVAMQRTMETKRMMVARGQIKPATV